MTGTAAKPPRRRVLRIVLVISLIVNVFLVGLLAGQVVSGRMANLPFGGAILRELPQIAQSLPEDDRATARRAFRQLARELMQGFRAVRTARQDVLDALSTEPFDVAALDRALMELRSRTDAAQAIAHQALLAIGPDLSPEGRAALAERAAALHRGDRHGGPD